MEEVGAGEAKRNYMKLDKSIFVLDDLFIFI